MVLEEDEGHEGLLDWGKDDPSEMEVLGASDSAASPCHLCKYH